MTLKSFQNRKNKIIIGTVFKTKSHFGLSKLCMVIVEFRNDMVKNGVG